MEHYLFFVILIFALNGADAGRFSEKFRYGAIGRDERCNVLDMDNDDERFFYEPCGPNNRVDCVQNFFARYGKCFKIRNSDNNPVYRESQASYMPNINLTMLVTKVYLKNLNGKIIRFYINEKTNYLVMAVKFDGLDIVSEKTYVLMSRMGKGPLVAADYANGTHSFISTANIPLDYGEITMDDAIITTYLLQRNNRFYLGPKITGMKDREFRRAINQLYANPLTSVHDYLHTESPSIFLAYLQKYICDFGIPITNFIGGLRTSYLRS